MKNDVLILLISIALFMSLILCFTFYERGERIKQISSYDVNKEHYIMHEEKGYNYCPYCGEQIGE